MKTEASTPSSVAAPGGIERTVGSGPVRFSMIEMDRGSIPELAVMARSPVRFNTRPNGCGATVTERPTGRRNRPFGRTVVPDLSMCVYSLSAGAERTVGAGGSAR